MAPTLDIGTVIALRYRIESLIAEGGMAAVYRARHVALGTPVALKVLPARRASPVGYSQTRFEREARNAARLDHPGCVRVFDYGVSIDGSRFLAMELLDGPSLRAELSSGEACRIDTAVWIVDHLLDALAHAHARGVLHRDIKPENVVFARRDGGHTPVLVDFGLSQQVDDAPLTAAGACVGSPSYLAPERLLGRAADERSDLYSIGVLFYELLAGARPFHASSPATIARLQVYEQAAPLATHRPEVPATLAAVIRTAMEKDPARRFTSATAMRTAVSAAMAFAARATPPALASPSAASPAPGRAHRSRPIRRRDEPSLASTCLELDAVRPSAKRLWSWLRFGSWRWRLRAA